MSIEQELGIFYIASVVSIIDVSLTYFILWYDRKLHPKHGYFQELNPLARLIMRLTDYGPLGLLIGALVSQTIIWYVCIGMTIVDPLKAIALGNFFTGAICVAIWIHVYSIKRLYKDNKVKRMLYV
jgi:uncharacterized membrane protein